MNPAVRAALGALLGAALGAWLGHACGGVFVAPEPLDPARWYVIVPGRDASVVDPRGRGTGVTGGALELVPHVFSRADVVTLREARPISALHVALAEGSGPLKLHLREGGHSLHLALARGAVATLPGEWRSVDGPLTVRIIDGTVRVGDVTIGRMNAPVVELSALDAPVRVRRLALEGADGATLVDEDFAATWAARAPVAPAAALGGLAGFLAARGGPAGLLALALPLVVTLVPSSAWLALVERLYLVRATPWGLAGAALALALAPLAVQALAATRRALPGAPADAHGEPRARGGGARPAAHLSRAARALPLLAAALASRDLSGAGWFLAPLGLAWLALPLAFARAARLDAAGLLLRDLPAQVVVAALGFPLGLLPATAWRLALLVAGAGQLLRRAPRAAADAIFLSGLLLVPASELAIRGSWVGGAWDAARLEGAAAWRDPTPFWEGTCGEAPRTVLFVGGSSTGGAYQFRDAPEAFFPAQVHARLCAAGAAVRTLNLGDGGRDSFTVSRSVDTLLAAHRPALIVSYLGVNDLLTAEHTRTRAEREAEEAARGAAAQGLDALARHSRLLTGLALLARPGLDTGAATVPNVPLADAEVNLRRIAAAARAAGAGLLLVTEYTARDQAGPLQPYEALQSRLGEELEGVEYADVRAPLDARVGEQLLVDRNHLSRRGGERLAEVLAPRVAERLGLPAPAAVSSGP